MKTVFAILVLLAGNAFAQAFPARPLRLIVPLVPGKSTTATLQRSREQGAGSKEQESAGAKA